MIHNTIAIFLIVLLVILVGSVLFKKLNIPSTVGLIVAGIAIGPFGFNLLERDASFRIFGDVGILYIMFQAAVEIDMFHLKAQLKKGILFGVLTALLPMAAGVLGTHYLLGQSWLTSALVASMFTSHTLITYPTVSKFGLQNTRPVVIAVCGTIVAVMVALLVLAGVSQISASGHYSVQQLLTMLALTAAFMLTVGYVFPPVTRYFFKSTTDPVAQYIYILAMVVIAALLAKIVGLEGILGAFYAGLVLNKLIPGRSPLMKNIRFVGDAIFIPYFLIGVGMLINVHVVVEGWSVLWAASIMSGLALGTKWIASYGAQKILKLSRVDRELIFGLTGGKAAATIAAVMIGYEAHLLNEDMMNASVVMILICCIIASVRTDRSALQLRKQETARGLDREELGSVEMARQVVAVANPITAEGLMRMALFMRKRQNTNPVTALFVRHNDDSTATVMGRDSLEVADSIAEEMDVPCNVVERFDLNAVSGICNLAHEQKATEIMIGMHRKSSVVDTFYGSFIEKLVTDCHRMVMLSRCFIPVGTISRIRVIVPPGAEYETGFHLWVTRLAMLASNIEARITFLSREDCGRLIRTAIADDGIEVDARYGTLNAWDDFILTSGDTEEADLIVLITARKGSISHTQDLDQITNYLSRHFRNNNLLIVYPKQF